MQNLSDELQALYNLKEQGALTEEEFAQAKKRVIEGEACAEASAKQRRAEPSASTANGPSALNAFRLSNRDRWFGGVCGGLGEQTGIPSWSWRILFLLLALLHGIGLVLYILLWIFVPRDVTPMRAQAAATPPPVPPQS